MPQIIILGSAAAIPDPAHANAQLLVRLKDQAVLIDCGDGSYLRLIKAGVGVEDVSDLILTHFHPDHAGGLPAFLITLWLCKRQSSLVIHGLEDTLSRAEALLDLFRWETWNDMYPVSFNRIPEKEMTTLIETPACKVIASPVKHLIPTIGLRMEFAGGSVAAYSCDTEPCTAVRHLAKEADLLLHETVGELRGHSSGAQAADLAHQAGAKRLVLIHYPPEMGKALLKQALAADFAGEITLAEDGAVYEL
ncbi:MAG: MBL fold metallo-hydrolase [Anaerolineaceae bacterium]|nr:MBL fold metallo-hydrolase [Anaerolineaceae bacterium]